MPRCTFWQHASLAVASWKTATAGEPCCYKSMQHASAPETPTGKEDFLRALFGRFGYSPTASGALKKDKRWLKVIIATTPYI